MKNSGINLHVLTRSGSFNTDGNGAKFCYALLLTGLVTKSLTKLHGKRSWVGVVEVCVKMCHLIYTLAEIYNHLGCCKTGRFQKNWHLLMCSFFDTVVEIIYKLDSQRCDLCVTKWEQRHKL